jgi:hypothetical protein
MGTRIRRFTFLIEEVFVDLILFEQRKAKHKDSVQTRGAKYALTDFAAMAGAVGMACPRADDRKVGQPPKNLRSRTTPTNRSRPKATSPPMTAWLPPRLPRSVRPSSTKCIATA